jgi:hypothetical protein
MSAKLRLRPGLFCRRVQPSQIRNVDTSGQIVDGRRGKSRAARVGPIVSLAAAILLSAASKSREADAANLIVNGGFEDGVVSFVGPPAWGLARTVPEPSTGR